MGAAHLFSGRGVWRNRQTPRPSPFFLTFQEKRETVMCRQTFPKMKCRKQGFLSSFLNSEARAGFPCAARPNLRDTSRLLSLRTETSVDDRAVICTLPTFSNGARRTPFSVTARAGECARSSRKGKTAHRAVFRTPLLDLTTFLRYAKKCELRFFDKQRRNFCAFPPPPHL